MADSKQRSQSKRRKRKRSTPSSSSALATSCNRRLRRKVVIDGKPTSVNYADQVNDNLIKIASTEIGPLALQATRMLMHLENLRSMAKGEEDEFSETTLGLSEKGDEEIKAEIKELRARLGPLVAADP